MDRRDRQALLAAVADELEATAGESVLDARDLRALCWRVVARSSGQRADRECADRECAGTASVLRDEVLRAYANARDLAPAPGHPYPIDGLRAVVAGMRGRRAEWYR